MSEIFVILGFHKSGTTMVAQMLAEAGVDMGRFESDKGYEEGNHWERAETQRLNKEILYPESGFSLDIRTVVSSTEVPERLWADGRSLVKRLSDGSRTWGFKDPRTILVYRAYWKKFLGRHTLIGVYRHPSEVFEHYVRRACGRNPLKCLSRAIKSLDAWAIYNEELLHIVEEAGDVVMVNATIVMNEKKGLETLESRLGHALSGIVKSRPVVGGSQSPKLLQIATWIVDLKRQRSVAAIFEALECARKKSNPPNLSASSIG